MTVAHRSFSLRAPRGFTLVELLVVIAIIGVLMSLTLPAIQSARETARMTECMNKVKQLATATASYESAWQQLPNGGWGQTWIGMPPYQKEKQPGGWIYQLLAYTEENNLATMITPNLQGANATRAKTAIPWLYCPTRRSPIALPYNNGTLIETTPQPTEAGRTDYAGNAGSSSVTCCEASSSQYPATLAAAPAFSAWIDPNNTTLNGAVVQRRGLRANDFSIGHGRGKVILYGEKTMDSDDYDTGNADGDKAPALSGFGNSIMRSTAVFTSGTVKIGLQADSKDVNTANCRFGSAHPGGANFAFCDISVRSLDFGIDPTVLSQIGNRKDTSTLNEGDFIK